MDDYCLNMTIALYGAGHDDQARMTLRNWMAARLLKGIVDDLPDKFRIGFVRIAI